MTAEELFERMRDASSPSGDDAGSASSCAWRARRDQPLQILRRATRLRHPRQRRHAVGGQQYTYYTRQVYSRCMSKVRTNIEIEDTYVEAIINRYGVRTKTQAVDLALRHLAGQPMSREEALAMRGTGAIGEVPADTGPLDAL